MKVIKMAVVCGTLVFSVFGVFACTQITPEDKSRTEAQSEPPPDAPKTTYYTHIIKWPGENLSRISRWYTGSEKNWLRILEVNPSINPKKIKIGDSIFIPEDLMTTHEPMPKSHLAPLAPVNKKKSAPSVKAAPQAGEMELFGPIDTAPQPSGNIGSDSPPPLETID